VTSLGRLLACGLVALGLAASAQAQEPPRVLVLERAIVGELEQEALSRLKGELRSLEFEVITLPLAAERDPEQAVNADGGELGPIAAFTLAARGAGLRLWMSDRVAHRLSVQDWAVADERLAATVALQGVELVRARLTEPAATESPPDVVTPASPPALAPPAPSLRLRAQAGVALALEPAARLESFLPLVRVSLARRFDALCACAGAVRVGAGAFGTALRLEDESGRARVTQLLVLAELVLELWPDAAVRPFAALGGGVDRRHVEGRAGTGFIARTHDPVSPLASAGLGLVADTFGPLALSLESQALVAARPARVQIAESDAATLGRPSFLISLGLVLTP
jgi:hypothetical protein